MAKPSSLNEAVAAVQRSGLILKKDASFNYGNYATLGAVIDLLRPALEENDLIVEQAPNLYEGREVLTTVLIHVPTDQARIYHSPLILEKDTMQKVGSAVTYSRRYALVSIFFLDADEDDDGNAASGDEAAAKQVGKKAKVARKPKTEDGDVPRDDVDGVPADKPRVF